MNVLKKLMFICRQRCSGIANELIYVETCVVKPCVGLTTGVYYKVHVKNYTVENKCLSVI
jgi:hypothetical protein